MKKRKTLRWKTKDELLLSQLYPDYHNKELAKKFRRTTEAIRRKAAKMGLKKDWEGGYRLPSPKTYNPDAWTDKEISELKKLRNSYTVKQISEKLGRTTAAVSTKIRKLGLPSDKGPKPWTKKELKFLRENYSKKTPKQISVKLGRTLRSVHLKAQRLNIKAPKTTWMQKDADFLKKHYNIWPLEKIAKKLNKNVKTIERWALKLRLREPGQRFWTESEIKKLNMWAKKYSIREIADKLDRPFESVKIKMRRVGIRLQKQWTRKDYAILKKYYPFESNKKVAERIGVSSVTVANKARQLKIKKSVNYKR